MNSVILLETKLNMQTQQPTIYRNRQEQPEFERQPPRLNANNTNNKKMRGIYEKAIITTKISIHIREIGRNLKQNLEKKLNHRISNKCIPEGYVKPNSVQIQTYSAGLVQCSENIEYDVIYQCWIAHPVNGMLIRAKVKHVTKAGLHCVVEDEEGNQPLIIFIIREHSVLNDTFNSVKEEDEIVTRVIGTRFELNDNYISVIAELHSTRPQQWGGEDGVEEFKNGY